MNSFPQMAATRHEYRLVLWAQGLYTLLGFALTAGGAFSAYIASADSGSPIQLVVPVFLLCLGLYFFALLRSRLVMEGMRIEVRGALKESTADLSEIEGYRTVNSRNGTYTQLCLKEGRGTITIAQTFDVDDDYRAWLQQLTDLDKRDRDVLLDEISNQQDLGATPKERLAALKQARVLSIVATVAAIAAALGLHIGADAFHLPLAVALALAPVAVLFLMRQSPLLYAVFKRKSDPRADLGFVLLAAGFGLALQFARFEFVSMKPLVPLMILVALAYIAAFFESFRRGSPMPAAVITLLTVSISYGFGLAITADTLLDNADATAYVVSVTGKNVVNGKSTTYYLELAPWGPVQEPNKISVSSNFYSETSSGDTVCLALHPGRLHAAWYHLAACSASPASEPTQ